MFQKLLGAAVGLMFAGMATVAQGAVYHNEADFNAAVAGLTLGWSENFETLSGTVAPCYCNGKFVVASDYLNGPVPIASGQAEISSSDTSPLQRIILQDETGNLAYWAISGTTVIGGPESSSLSVSAFSFNYNMGGVGNNRFKAILYSTTGTSEAWLFETSVHYPDGEWGLDVPVFLGWVGAPGELLLQVVVDSPSEGIVIDNITGFNAVPLPAALPLFASGLGVMGLLAWRRKRKASKGRA